MLKNLNVPKDLALDPDEFELTTGESWNETFKHENWKCCVTIEPRDEHEAFKIMECFIDEIDDKRFSRKIVDTLYRKRPFANFKALIEGSKYRQQWFDFKQASQELMVRNEISFPIKTVK